MEMRWIIYTYLVTTILDKSLLDYIDCRLELAYL